MEPAVDIIQGGGHLEEADDHQYEYGQDDGEDDLTCPLGTKKFERNIPVHQVPDSPSSFQDRS